MKRKSRFKTVAQILAAGLAAITVGANTPAPNIITGVETQTQQTVRTNPNKKTAPAPVKQSQNNPISNIRGFDPTNYIKTVPIGAPYFEGKQMRKKKTNFLHLKKKYKVKRRKS